MGVKAQAPHTLPASDPAHQPAILHSIRNEKAAIAAGTWTAMHKKHGASGKMPHQRRGCLNSFICDYSLTRFSL
jgi:hypothetical protein